MKEIGVAVIGLQVGRHHLEGYSKCSNVKIRAICDLDPKVMDSLAQKYKVERKVTDYKRILGMDDVDVVSVATPDYFHCEQAVELMRAGKNVLCEKPMALEIAECCEMLDTAKATGVKFMVGQVCRFTPGFVLTKRLIDEGMIGDIFYVESEYAHNYCKSAGVAEWRKDSRREPIIGGGCHAVDLLRWIGGEVEEVFAYSNHKAMPDWPVDDCIIAAMKFKNNNVGKVFVSIGCKRPYTMRSVFYGTQGTIISDNTTPFIQIYSDKNQKEHEFSLMPVELNHHNITEEIRVFIDAIINDTPVESDAREGMMTVAVCRAIVQSIKSGKPVTVDSILKCAGVIL